MEQAYKLRGGGKEKKRKKKEKERNYFNNFKLEILKEILETPLCKFEISEFILERHDWILYEDENDSRGPVDEF